MSKIKISIIIPVYNVQKYINCCVKSILNQCLENYEIILVNDGSSDDSGRICDKLKEKNDNIKVIHQKNMGLSAARNSGIKIASGEYLMFVDGDDYINSEVNLDKIIKSLTGEVIQYKWVYFYEKSNKFIYFKDKKSYEDVTNFKQVLENKVQDGSISVSACDKFVKRQVIINNNLYFKEGIFSEDLEWSLRLYQHIQSIKTINENIYVYRQQRKDSITSKIKEKNVISLYDIINYWYNYKYLDDITKRTYLGYLSYHYIILLTIINKKNCSKEMKKNIYSIRSILDYTNNDKANFSKKIMNIFGYRIGRLLFKTYLILKSNGVLKL